MSKRYFFAEQKYRVDLAASFFVYINLILLMIVAYETHFYPFFILIFFRQVVKYDKYKQGCQIRQLKLSNITIFEFLICVTC